MTYHDYFVASVDETLGELVDVRFDSTGLWIEKVTHQATSQQARQKEREGGGEYAMLSGIGQGVSLQSGRHL